MRHVQAPRQRHRVTQGLVLTALLAVTSGCGLGSDSAAADLPETTVEDSFTVQDTEDGWQLIAGHGISFAVPEAWVPVYDETFDGQVYSWELRASEGDPFPPFVNFTVNTEKEPESRVEEVATAAKGVAETTEEGFELLEDSETDIPGSDTARDLQFKRMMNLASADQDYPIQQQMLFFQLPESQVVTVRLLAPEGTFEDSPLPEIRDSLVVNQKKS
jgi:hypothetical protein